MQELNLEAAKNEVTNMLHSSSSNAKDWKYQADILAHRAKVFSSEGSISWLILGYENPNCKDDLAMDPLLTPKVIASGSGDLKAFVEVDEENQLTKHMKYYGYLYWIYARIHIRDKGNLRRRESFPFDLKDINLGSKKLLLLSYRHEDEKQYAQFTPEERVKAAEIKYLMAIKAQLHGHIVRKLFNHHIYLQAFPKYRLLHKNLYPRIMQSVTVDHEHSNLILVLKIKHTIPSENSEEGDTETVNTTILPLVKYMKSSNTIFEVKQRIVRSMNNRGLAWKEDDLKLITVAKKSNDSILRTFTMNTKVSIRQKSRQEIPLYETTIIEDNNKTLGQLGITSGSEILVEREEKVKKKARHQMFQSKRPNRLRLGRSMLKSAMIAKQRKEIDFINTVRSLEHRDIDHFTSKSKKIKATNNKKKKQHRESILRKKQLINISRELGANFIETGDLIITKKKPLGVGRTARVFEGLLRCHVTEDNVKEGLTVFEAPEGEKMVIKTNKKGQIITSILQKFAPKKPRPQKTPEGRDRGLSYASVGEVLTLEPLEVAIKVAIKQFTCRVVTETVAKAFQQEIQALCRIDHVGVVRCLGIYVNELEKMDDANDNLQLLIVYELCARGDLRDLKNEKSWPSVPFVRRYAMMLPAIEALAFVHGQGMVHRDLKVDNILVSENFTFKIGDFGVAKILNPNIPNSVSARIGESSVKGTLGYTAPEVASGKSSGTIASDIFSFGVVLYELISDYKLDEQIYHNPNPLLKNVDLYEEQFENNAHLDSLVFSPETPDDLKNLIKDCLRTIPAERCSAKDILSVVSSLLD